MKQTKRKNLCLALALAMLLSALSGCRKTEQTDEEPSNDIDASNVVSGETLTSGAAADSVFSLAVDYEKPLNPITTRSTLNQMVDELVYDRLFYVDSDFKLSSRILEDWYYSKNENGSGTWVLTVRDGIMMHDGSTLTAEDISYSLSRVYTSGSTFYQQQMGRVYVSAFQGQVYVSGDYANGLLPWRLSVPIIKSYTNSILEQVPVGSGPYTYSEDRSCLEKFENYENADQLPLDKIYLRAYTGPEELITEYESALVDLVLNDPTSVYNMGYGGKNETREFATTNMHFLCFNSRSEFFQYEPYRTAMLWLIDRDTIADTVLDGAMDPSVLFIHPNSSLYDSEFSEAYGYDPARAKIELERGGCRDLDGDGMLEFALSGSKVEISINFVVCADNAEKVAAARQIASDMEAIGLGVHMRELTWNEYLSVLRTTDDEDDEDDDETPDWTWDVFYGEIAIQPDWNCLTLFIGDWQEDGTLNYGRWYVPELESAMNEFIGAKEDDRAAARTAMLQAYVQNCAFLTVGFEKREVLSHIGVIKGMDPNQYCVFTDLTKWTIDLDS